jgi:hypothetical protein
VRIRRSSASAAPALAACHAGGSRVQVPSLPSRNRLETGGFSSPPQVVGGHALGSSWTIVAYRDEWTNRSTRIVRAIPRSGD